jgi:hypothetical protein
MLPEFQENSRRTKMSEILNPLMELLQNEAQVLGISPSTLAVCLITAAYLLVIPWIKIFRRVGMSEGLGILMLIPVINVVIFFIFAYLEWPIEREIRRFESPIWRS